MKSDIVIIGGGIVGSSIAYHLTRTGRAGTVTVVEPDPTYEFASTPRGSGGVRQLFSLPENVALSRYSLEFYKAFPETMAVDGEPARIDFHRRGYLFLARQSGAAQLEANWHVQVAGGARVELLDRDAVLARFPSLNMDDMVMGAHSPDDGWLDPHGAMQGFRRKAIDQGARYVQDRVVGVDMPAGVLRSVMLVSGRTIEASAFVIAAGAWSGEIAAMLGMPLPVEPMSRVNHYFEVRAEIEPLPFVKEQGDLAFRPEGRGYIGGVPLWEMPAGFWWPVDHSHFEARVWPALARRVTQFEAAKCLRTWVGHYERNALDQNGIIGRWEGGSENVYVATGFSGHGIMHAPGTGLAMAELILDGRFATMDLARLGWTRIRDNAPYGEKGII